MPVGSARHSRRWSRDHPPRPRYALESAVEIPETGWAVAPLSPPRQSTQALAVLSLPAVLSLLSPPASRTARPPSPSSRTALVSARAQPPSHTGDRRSTQLASPKRVEPWLSLSPEADARPDQSDSQACSRCIESCLKSPLVRPGARTLGLSLSFDSMLIGLVGWLDQRFPVSVKVMGAPAATWPWSVQGGSERPRAALPLIVCLRIAIGRACARPPPIGYGWALLWQCLRR